jgi:hypothetical protein
MWARIKRWLYRGDRPSRLTRWINDGVARLHASGLGPASWVTLRVVGRRSGREIAFPLVMAVVDGERFLVSMLGSGAAWVQNVRAAGGEATLRRGGDERVRLEEVPVPARAPVLKAYLQIAPGARPHVPVPEDAPLARFAEIAARFPVFRVVRSTAAD